MKSKFLILAAVLFITATSCKKDGENKTTSAPGADVKKNFSVELDVASEKDDAFALYFTEDATIDFNTDHVVWSAAKGGNTSQKVAFNLSEEIIPTHIRLDFGLKKGTERGDVTLSNVKVMNYGKSFEFKGSDFFKYFIANDSIKTQIDATAGTIKFLKDPKSKVTPFFYPTQMVQDEIAKITK